MPCRPLSVSLEVDPDPSQKIVFTLDKTCNSQDEATWKMTFDLQQGTPLATVVNLKVEIDPENHPQAEATAVHGLDDNQQGQAQIAAIVAQDPTASAADKNGAVKQVIAARDMSATATAGAAS